MFASRANKYENGDTNGLDVLNNAGHHLQNPELVDLMDDGIDIVRIKTTEEVSEVPPVQYIKIVTHSSLATNMKVVNGVLLAQWYHVCLPYQESAVPSPPAPGFFIQK